MSCKTGRRGGTGTGCANLTRRLYHGTYYQPARPRWVASSICPDLIFGRHTQEGDGEGQGVRIEEVIHVTKTGVEILSKWPVKEITVIPI